jgi:peptide/nickel transport system permease protein
MQADSTVTRANEPVAAVELSGRRPLVTPTGYAWRRFRRHKLALAGLVTIILLIIVAVFAPLVSRYPPNKINLREKENPPTLAHWLGTDQTGRDVWSRIIYGARISLLVGFASAGVVTVLGTVLGALMGYHGGVVDGFLSRLTDSFMCFPTLIIVTVLVAMLSPGIQNTILVIGLFWWPSLARLVRGQFLSLREMDYVLASRALGAKPNTIIFRHILPNAVGPVLVQMTFLVIGAILTEASLSFLGLGVNEPTASWGSMLFHARTLRILEQRPWLWIPPGMMIVITALSVNFIGDALRDAFDPRMVIE